MFSDNEIIASTAVNLVNKTVDDFADAPFESDFKVIDWADRVPGVLLPGTDADFHDFKAIAFRDGRVAGLTKIARDNYRVVFSDDKKAHNFESESDAMIFIDQSVA